MTKSKNGLQIASVILISVSLVISVLSYPFQAILYWHFKTFPASSSGSPILETCLGIALHIVLLGAFIKLYDKAKNILILIYLLVACANSIFTLVINSYFSVVQLIYLVFFAFITVDCFRKFKLIKVSFALFAVYLLPILANLIINIYFAITLSAPYFVTYIEAAASSFGTLCLSISILLYLLSRLKRTLQNESTPESM